MSRLISRENNIWRALRSLIYFQLFELLVVVLVISSLYFVLIGNLLDIESKFETAEVTWTMTALKTASQAERTTQHLRRALGKVPAALPAGISAGNPMRLLSPMPRNYIGEFCDANPNRVQKGSWYFDKCNNWLVYVFAEQKIFSSGHPRILKFNVESLRLLTEPANISS
jgi:hypothetical protein